MAKRRLPPWDDGRVIASMDVEGMPWRRADKKGLGAGDGPKRPPLSPHETRWMILGALKAALVIGGVFSLVIIAFVALLAFAWNVL